MQMNWVLSFIINLLSALIFFLLGVVSKSIFDTIRKKNPVRSFWGECLKSSVNIIVPSGPENYDEFSFHTGYSDLTAAAEIKALLTSHHKKPKEIRILEVKHDGNRLKENLVLIGGPVTNEITMRIFQDIAVPFSFMGHTLIDNLNSKEYKPKSDTNGQVLEDYGLVLRNVNPYNKQKEIIIIAGCYGHGTYSGAVAVTDYEILRDINRKVKPKSRGILVKSHVIHEIPQKPDLVEIFGYE